MRLIRFAFIRLLQVAAVVFGAIVLTFVLVRILPGDPALAFVGANTSAEDLVAIRERLGLNTPLWQQFLEYMGGLFVGDLGTSLNTGTPVAVELAVRLVPTLQLVFAAVAVAVVLALILGIWSARRAGKFTDHTVRVTSLIGTSLPEFWLGLILIVLGYRLLGWFPPPSGRIARGQEPAVLTGGEAIDALLTGNIPSFFSAMSYMALPMLVIVVAVTAALVRNVRAAALEIIEGPAWEAAVSHGVRKPVLFRSYLLRGVMARIPSLVALVLGNVLGGVVLVEYVFSWQGMGQWLLRGLLIRDYPVVQAGVVVIAIVYATAYLVADIVQAALDPRIKL